ncbi:MAG TPA: PilN domain-containing protein [Ignavibacteriaceae bacterium]
MINIPMVNLLPWREALRKEKQREFVSYATLCSGAAVALVFLGFVFLDSQLDDWKSDNEYLKSETLVLNKQIEEISELKEQTEALLSRKQVIENLQQNRSETVNILRELANLVPDGVLLRNVKQVNGQINLTGSSQSNAKISALMKALDVNDYFENSTLLESKSAVLSGRKVYDFSMNVSVTRLKNESDTSRNGKQKPVKKEGA